MISSQLSDDPSRTPHRGDLHTQPNYIARFPGGAPYCSPKFYARWSLLGSRPNPKRSRIAWCELGHPGPERYLISPAGVPRVAMDSRWAERYRRAAGSFLGTCESAPDR